MSSGSNPPSAADDAAAGSSPSAGSRNNARRVHFEDVLPRLWNKLAESVILATQKAEKVATEQNSDTAKELNEATHDVLRRRVEWSNSLAYLEAKLVGKAEEMEALQQYVRCHPKVGRKRRKVDAVAATAATESLPATPVAGTPESEGKATLR